MANQPNASVTNSMHIDDTIQAKVPDWWAAVVALIIAFAVLILGIYRIQLRPDEGFTFTNMQYSFVESMTRLAFRNNQAHLWWMNIWGWQRLVGTHEVPMRVNSILYAMLSLSIVYQIAKSWFKSRQIGLFAMVLLPVNTFFFLYNLEMRMYALAMLATVLSMRFFQLWLQKRTLKLALFYGLTVPLMMYTHYYLAFVVIVQVLYFILRHGLNWRLWRQAIAAALLALVVWLPGILILYSQLTLIDFAEVGGLKIPTDPTTPETIWELILSVTNGFWFIYVPLLVLALVRWWRSSNFWLAVTWGIGIPVVILVVNLFGPIYTQRYVSFLIVGLGLLYAAGLTVLPRPVAWLLLIGLFIGGYATVTNNMLVRIPYRDIYTPMGEMAEPDDVIFVQHDADNFKFEMMARYLPDGLMDNLIYTLEEAEGHRRVWHLTHEFLTPAVQETFNALKQDRVVLYNPPASNCTRAYCYVAQLLVGPPDDTITYFGEQVGFRGADIVDITDEQLQMHLWWYSEATPDRDYSISVQMLDEDGALVTQTDGPVTSYFGGQTIQTSAMMPNTIYLGVRNLNITNVSPGEYTLALVVYWWEDGERLLLPDGSDSLTLQTVTIP
ncbi:glycosyltransferase family 39 protein [Phototrophicus methaneseepsis]|uniref:Glycosyltransferase family 39 protein n=1 Tax=Phototrophicus methaneseepsis TaxID=2710758 RepID=A0A7S8E7W6_9CHLR|nr:glycosyltransferase family 39 protein [Phototrophicus methaneseepsis]QPC81984.1 glycosyltransferase family 39 protein [Phototrophicus methaneseepsis]